jgi:alginate O-acetyltransferase complex protein AlgI
LKQPQGEDLVEGLARVIIGFGKKTVVASLFFNVARPYLELGADFNAGFDRFTTPYLWLCVTAYYLYLYLDFSAYSDLAIGASRMMGFKIMENFRWPILATNVSDFWQRWHISLTSWVTDYIYIPLGGNRHGLFAAARYSLIAMITIGAWHGMNLHFIAWGFYHAIFLILYRQWRKSWKEKWFPKGLPGPNWLQTGLAWFVTFQVINLGWVLFNFKIGQSLRIWLKLFWLS